MKISLSFVLASTALALTGCATEAADEMSQEATAEVGEEGDIRPTPQPPCTDCQILGPGSWQVVTGANGGGFSYRGVRSPQIKVPASGKCSVRHNNGLITEYVLPVTQEVDTATSAVTVSIKTDKAIKCWFGVFVTAPRLDIKRLNAQVRSTGGHNPGPDAPHPGPNPRVPAPIPG